MTTTRGSFAACVGMCVIQGLQELINTHNLQFVSHYSPFSLPLLCPVFLSVSTLICDCVLLFVYIFIHSRFECSSPGCSKTSEYFMLSAKRGRMQLMRLYISDTETRHISFVFGPCYHVVYVTQSNSGEKRMVFMVCVCLNIVLHYYT